MTGHAWRLERRVNRREDTEHRSVCECGFASPWMLAELAAVARAHRHLKAVVTARRLSREAHTPIPPHPARAEAPHVTRERMAAIDEANKRLREKGAR